MFVQFKLFDYYLIANILKIIDKIYLNKYVINVNKKILNRYL